MTAAAAKRWYSGHVTAVTLFTIFAYEMENTIQQTKGGIAQVSFYIYHCRSNWNLGFVNWAG